mmetsp:Transcript_83443/g.200206  ORF Transcript_83443/g.200206 Transcript_83443/m.200206 type:complete len:209 (-) Transcript_83443:151-777(-)
MGSSVCSSASSAGASISRSGTGATASAKLCCCCHHHHSSCCSSGASFSSRSCSKRKPSASAVSGGTGLCCGDAFSRSTPCANPNASSSSTSLGSRSAPGAPWCSKASCGLDGTGLDFGLDCNRADGRLFTGCTGFSCSGSSFKSASPAPCGSSACGAAGGFELFGAFRFKALLRSALTGAPPAVGTGASGGDGKTFGRAVSIETAAEN